MPQPEVIEECKESNLGQQLSGITENNISEGENDVQIASNEKRKTKPVPTDFVAKHEIQPTPPDDAQDWKDAYLC